MRAASRWQKLMRIWHWQCRFANRKVWQWGYGCLATLIVLSNSGLSAPSFALAPTTSIEIAQSRDLVAKLPENLKPDNDLKRLPDRTPVTVTVGLHVSNLAQIDQSNETASIVGYLLYSWQDPRLTHDGTSSIVTSLDKIWHPALEIVNFKSSDFSETFVDIAPDGTVNAQERFSKTMSSGLALQGFPFDRQKLLIAIESLLYPLQDLEFLPDPAKISLSKESFATLAEWKLQGIHGTKEKSFFSPEQQDYSRLAIVIKVERNPGFYILKVMLPLLLITLASWSVFWIDPQEFSTQISISFTNLLTVVALLLVINDSLPKVGYLTFMDGFTMLCFMGILGAIVELILVHRWGKGERHIRAQTIHGVAKWLFPLLFILGNIILIIVTF